MMMMMMMATTLQFLAEAYNFLHNIFKESWLFFVVIMVSVNYL
jgi:hypothetical protein